MTAQRDLWAGTFSDYAAWMAVNCPHALVMDFWRRLEFVLREYSNNRGRTSATLPEIERMLGEDDNLGREVHGLVSGLRRLRNRVAHEPGVVAPDDAIQFAQEALRLVAAIGYGRPPEQHYLPVEF